MVSKQPIEQNWSKRTKFLTQALIISGTLNIALVSTFFYFVLQDKQTAVSFENAPVKSAAHTAVSNEQCLLQFSTMSFSELLSLLESKESMEASYKKRDLALAALVAFHHFNLQKALGTAPQQQRTVSFLHEGIERVDLTIYPGLSDDQFEAILRFAKTEKWPYTAEGLFFEIKQSKPPQDPTLLESFYLTQEFNSIATLFSRAGFSFQKEVLIELISQGDWQILKEFTLEQKQVQDLSPARLRDLLVKFLKKRSLIAARVLVEIDREFLVKRLEDPDLLLLLDVIAERSTPVDLLLKELLFSPRSDAVWRKAGEKLYGLAGLPVPEPYDHHLTIRTFFPANVPPPSVASSETEKKKGKRTYIVQHGDSLWKIAKKHKVSVEALRQQNRLESEKLKPGKELEIPEK